MKTLLTGTKGHPEANKDPSGYCTMPRTQLLLFARPTYHLSHLLAATSTAMSGYIAPSGPHNRAGWCSLAPSHLTAPRENKKRSHWADSLDRASLSVHLHGQPGRYREVPSTSPPGLICTRIAHLKSPQQQYGSPHLGHLGTSKALGFYNSSRCTALYHRPHCLQHQPA